MTQDALDRYVAWWRACPVDAAPIVHPADRAVLDRCGDDLVDRRSCDFTRYVQRDDLHAVKSERLRLGLLPMPHAGDLGRADIVVLLLNPGVSHGTFYGESEVPAFRASLVASLRQDWSALDRETRDAPFPYLDPRFAWEAGFAWWERRLRGVLLRLAQERCGGSYPEALRTLSRRFAVVQRVPYHSGVSPPRSLMDRLDSVNEARRLVQDWLLPEVSAGSRTVIVVRQAASWGLPPDENVVVYEGGETRGAALGPDTRGGRAILARLGLACRLHP